MHDNLSIRLQSSKDGIAQEWFDQADAHRVNTDAAIFRALEQQYPDRHITVIPEYDCSLLAYAASGNALAIPDPDKNATIDGAFGWHIYRPAARRLDGDKGSLLEFVLFGKYKYAWRDSEFTLYIVDGRDGSAAYPQVRLQYVISASKAKSSTEELLLAAGSYNSQLHNQIWVFDQGRWQKDAGLYQSMMKARWEDVILDPQMKKDIQEDVNRFFESRNIYERLRVPWKRGIIYHGPPGNGKTISIKATMHTLFGRTPSVPTLYVKTLAGFMPPEYMLGEIFRKARAEAPCFLVLEDLDSIVRDNVRSFFLNEVDGLSPNDGILMIGSTNYLDRLDPGIAKRPSRFDRKYYFPKPNFDERVLYCQYWRRKLEGNNEGVDFPDRLCPAIAKITEKFSFAYLQEVFVAALLQIAGRSERDDDHIVESCIGEYFVEHGGGSDDDLEKLVLWKEIKKQVKALRDEMGDDDDEKGVLVEGK